MMTLKYFYLESLYFTTIRNGEDTHKIEVENQKRKETLVLENNTSTSNTMKQIKLLKREGYILKSFP